LNREPKSLPGENPQLNLAGIPAVLPISQNNDLCFSVPGLDNNLFRYRLFFMKKENPKKHQRDQYKDQP